MGDEVVKDSDGVEVNVGDLIYFAYGIPPVAVTARVAEKKGRLVALTPEHKPTECRLDRLKGYVGDFYKIEKLAGEVGEVEAKLFSARKKGSRP